MAVGSLIPEATSDYVKFGGRVEAALAWFEEKVMAKNKIEERNKRGKRNIKGRDNPLDIRW